MLYSGPTSVPYLQKRITKMLGSEYRKGYLLIIQIHRFLLLIFWFFTLKLAKTSIEY